MTVVDPDVVRVMYDDHSVDLFAYLARRVGRQVAEDLLAETFRAAIESFGSFDPVRGTQRVWLFGIATNLIRRHWHVEKKRLKTLQHLELRIQADDESQRGFADAVAGRVDAQLDAPRLLAAVCELDPEDRDLLFLWGWEDMNSREVGAVLGISPGAVRTRLHRVRQHLRIAMTSRTNSDPSTSGVTS